MSLKKLWPFSRLRRPSLEDQVKALAEIFLIHEQIILVQSQLAAEREIAINMALAGDRDEKHDEIFRSHARRVEFYADQLAAIQSNLSAKQKAQAEFFGINPPAS